jgi:hypothetical protein
MHAQWFGLMTFRGSGHAQSNGLRRLWRLLGVIEVVGIQEMYNS